MIDKKKQICIGLLAHVDAGKTTLSESMLYESGRIRRLGRVDKGDTFLDTFSLEKQRGITVFSKQAIFSLPDMEIHLLDTPGHVDFSTEMERTLQVLDYAILIIGGTDGVQGHTETLWDLLKKYHIPTFLFVNKMDMPGADANAILKNLRGKLAPNIVDFTEDGTDDFYENVAVCDEALMNQYLEEGELPLEAIQDLIYNRDVFPCYFGSALKIQGVDRFMEGMNRYCLEQAYGDQFSARVYKITRDSQGNRLTHMKITGGCLQVKDVMADCHGEKINQIRLYSGEKYESVKQVEAGMICAVTGLSDTFAGQGLGMEQDTVLPFLEPVLTYAILLPEEVSPVTFLPKLRQLEEEDPALHIRYDEDHKEISVQVMGEVQLEILNVLIKERLGVAVSFGPGQIVYKETITDVVEGVGHFEPLRHYAEVHVLLQPLPEGSGIQIDSICNEDLLAKNWQRLILTHLEEKLHRGVLTGAPITDIRITLVAGRAHQKHTEGGDFRQATYRAVRHGLMMAKSVLLEPYYQFKIDIPTDCVGRVMMDVEKMQGTCVIAESDHESSVLTGEAPVSSMNGYQKEITAFSRGHGHLSCVPCGYRPCHNSEEIIAKAMYDPEADLDNPAGSVFCSHGAGFVVPWNEVYQYMHLLPVLKQEGASSARTNSLDEQELRPKEEIVIGTDEIDEILRRTFHANKKDEFRAHKGISRRNIPKRPQQTTRVVRNYEKKEPYLLVDGYNVIHAWDELKELAEVNLDAARTRLADELCNYQGAKKVNLILVFDAYRVKGHDTEIFDYHNIHVVYTKEAETADAYIEKFAHENGRKYDITVATSDGLEQVIIIGAGCKRMSSRELKEEVERSVKEIRDMFKQGHVEEKVHLFDAKGVISEDERKKLEDAIKRNNQ